MLQSAQIIFVFFFFYLLINFFFFFFFFFFVYLFFSFFCDKSWGLAIKDMFRMQSRYYGPAYVLAECNPHHGKAIGLKQVFAPSVFAVALRIV